ncbi:MAG: alpha-hydroxy-acid oxidizing protein [Actinomycetota bacterium]|nr:alpha-hydroxy-acid oxidizing protein [Actinomycetota bacterium]
MIEGLVNLGDLEGLARERLDPAAFAYYAGGAADEVTLADNEAAWSRHRLRPRVLVDVSRVDPSATILGTPVRMPVGVAPTALHGLGHAEAELATARAAARSGVLFTLSSLASRPLEDLAPVDGPRWYQLYAHSDRAITADIVHRAEAHGFGAIVLTVDLPVFGRREREARSGFSQPSAAGYGNFAPYARDGDVAAVTAGLHTSLLTWADVDWLRGLTTLPLVLKGVLTGEDAAAACEHGFDAVWVSNHGGRQLDRTPASVDVLEEVVGAVAGRAEVYLDGGVRRGTDVLVARALGATAVFAGRPWLYALSVGGEDGVADALALLGDELVNAMALLGTPTMADVTRSHAD